MFTSLLLTSLIATSANALYFHFSPFVTTDIRIPSESHAISFTISNPTANFEQGGSAPRNCSISWSGSEVPTCWKECEGDGWPHFARVTPKSWSSAGDFELDVQRYHVYRAPSVFNVTGVPIVEGALNGYACSRGGQSTVCTFQNTEQGFNVMVGNGGEPVEPTPQC
ncbi:hypothetical protein CLAFUW4_14780 [Fulvia fulva]|uniref:Uncharacterized protein n=1 Tax=Passalora fulva TaxID=5499 RepID=A0A9Q8PMA1_PASFU|nr:uncharacterized protein CLAFUR5_14607 [Fulvia fulva]KAK4609235.1 hypothetical protein CLAFUR4_14772 [Fulvia fulva]KAK4609531.1 hypothetical protein CLAFUR0_14772 [Fulvia fulva]UJO25229.1 hypothetical protein CLAFUR5_14607 [Fulvia fulva]WPV22689.1 hypothetical protein CLAFUW4_14780 [Fulvia fulva]WPV37507.1 hypothetical protein CLAFUW7_14781 [Fulvia fulva]